MRDGKRFTRVERAERSTSGLESQAEDEDESPGSLGLCWCLCSCLFCTVGLSLAAASAVWYTVGNPLTMMQRLEEAGYGADRAPIEARGFDYHTGTGHAW